MSTYNIWLFLLLAVYADSQFTPSSFSSTQGTFPNPYSVQFENGMYDTFATHPCRRQCRLGSPMTCYYKLYLQDARMVGPECRSCLTSPGACAAERCIYGDGLPYQLQLINWQLPGPLIEVCQDDTLIVDTYNNMTEESTIHFHGIHMSKTPESDGVPMVTQYAIQPGTVHRVCFEVEEDGTEWYHSHMSWQRVYGLAGGLIVRTDPSRNPYWNLYDYDEGQNVMMIQDLGTTGAARNILINGKGRNPQNNWPINDPRNRYHDVIAMGGKLHRWRVIFNGATNCPIEISIQNHRFQAIATDGNNIETRFADKWQMTAGERFDVIIYANNPAGAYWIKVTGTIDCANITQYAILRYNGVPTTQFPSQPMQDLPGLTVISNTNIPAQGLKALAPVSCSPTEPRIKYYVALGFVVVDGEAFLQIDNITDSAAPISMLQGRHLYNDDQTYCNRTSLKNANIDCGTTFCQCPNVIRMPAYKCIEIIVVNYMNVPHPWHMHGYTFRLVGQDTLGNLADAQNIEELDRKGRLKRLPLDYRAVEKDTIQVTPYGYSIMQFHSDNPGFWLMHCHIERHSIEGMSAVVRVGENNQIKKIVSVNKCLGPYCG